MYNPWYGNVIGSQIGSRLHAKIDESKLGLSIILLFVAIWMIMRGLLV